MYYVYFNMFISFNIVYTLFNVCFQENQCVEGYHMEYGQS